MTARQTTNNAGALLFTFNIPGTMRLFVNMTVRLFGFTVIFGHVAIV